VMKVQDRVKVANNSRQQLAPTACEAGGTSHIEERSPYLCKTSTSWATDAFTSIVAICIVVASHSPAPPIHFCE